jgi:hypothetical protein
VRSVWEESKHPWLSFACTLEHFQRGRGA